MQDTVTVMFVSGTMYLPEYEGEIGQLCSWSTNIMRAIKRGNPCPPVPESLMVQVLQAVGWGFGNKC